jgi:hypothetical protein
MPDNLPNIKIDENLSRLGIDKEEIRGYEIMGYVWKYIKDNNLTRKRD